MSYDPAYVYELAVILQDGVRRMYEAGEDVFYYITMYNEDYAMPAMPEGVSTEGIVRGIYKFRAGEVATKKGKAPATVPVVWVGADLERGACGADDAGGEVPSAGGCVECDQL